MKKEKTITLPKSVVDKMMSVCSTCLCLNTEYKCTYPDYVGELHIGMGTAMFLKEESEAIYKELSNVYLELSK